MRSSASQRAYARPVRTHLPSSIYTQAQASSSQRRGASAPQPGALPPPGSGRCLRAGGGSTARSGGEWPHSGRLFGCVGVCVRALNIPATRLPRGPPSPSAAPATAPPEVQAAPATIALGLPAPNAWMLCGDPDAGKHGSWPGQRERTIMVGPPGPGVVLLTALILRPALGLCCPSLKGSRARASPSCHGQDAGQNAPALCPSARLSHLGTNRRPGNVLLLKLLWKRSHVCRSTRGWVGGGRAGPVHPPSPPLTGRPSQPRALPGVSENQRAFHTYADSLPLALQRGGIWRLTHSRVLDSQRLLLSFFFAGFFCFLHLRLILTKISILLCSSSLFSFYK